MPLHRAAMNGAARMAALLALFAIAASGTGDVTRPRRAPKVTLLYVGAEDCAPCRAWQQHDKVAFAATTTFARLTYREVRSATLFNVLSDENWPEDMRGYRSLLGPDAGVPLWLVISDAQVVHRGMGSTQWNSGVLPELRKLLR